MTVVTDRRVLQLVGRTVTARPLLPAGTWVSFARDGASLVGLRAAGQTFVARSIDGGRSWRRERAIPGGAGELAIGAGHVAGAAGANGTGHRCLRTWPRP